MIKLVACDIDGTLLQGEDEAIANAVFHEITRLQRRGIQFCPASGRQYSSLRRLFAPVADSLYYLCDNGAVVFGPGAHGTVLAKEAMDQQSALQLSREIIATSGCEVMISGVDTSYLCPKHSDMVELVRDFVGNNVSVIACPEDIPEQIIKVSAYCRHDAREEEHGALSRWKDTFHMALGGGPWLDFTIADKGIGLKNLCDALRTAPDEVMAFGDNYNDVPMLELAGTAYIMDSAAPPLRRMFPKHCSKVEEVLARL